MNQTIGSKKKKKKKKAYFPISRLQVMHTDVHLHCFVDETFFTKLLSFHEEMISLQIILANLLPRGELQIDAINSNFEIF